MERKQGRQTKNVARQVAIYYCQRLGLHKQKEIAEYFSLSHRGSISSTVFAIESQAETSTFKKLLAQVRCDLNLTKRT